LAPSWFFR
jgi:membrane protein